MMYGSREFLFMVLSSLYEVAIPIFNLYLLANISLIAPICQERYYSECPACSLSTLAFVQTGQRRKSAVQ